MLRPTICLGSGFVGSLAQSKIIVNRAPGKPAVSEKRSIKPKPRKPPKTRKPPKC
jgi:hypothetical protein